jgi:REP element-mobilizing transposase RayT
VFTDSLRELFLEVLFPIRRDNDWTIYGWALMTNHYHLVLRTGEAGLSVGMHALQNRIARASNAALGRINHAFGKRFWSEHIEDDAQLHATIAYVLWNPARVGRGAHPADSDWTSYRATIGLDPRPPCLDAQAVLAHYGAVPDRQRESFVRYVGDPGWGRARRAA